MMNAGKRGRLAQRKDETESAGGNPVDFITPQVDVECLPR